MENRFQKGNSGGRDTSNMDLVLDGGGECWDEGSANGDGKKRLLWGITMDIGVERTRQLCERER